jgi:hypothetical protein
MKTNYALWGALLVSAASLAGCAGVAQQNAQASAPTPVPTPAQIAAQVCPPLQVTLESLQSLPALPAGAQADLALAVPAVDAVCGIGAAVDVSSLQALERTAVPVLANLVKTAALSPAEQDSVLAVQIMLSTALAIADPVQTPASPAPQPATPSTQAATAP